MQLGDGLMRFWKIYGRDRELIEGMMMGFVMVVIWKVVKSDRVCAGNPILLSLRRPDFSEKNVAAILLY